MICFSQIQHTVFTHYNHSTSTPRCHDLMYFFLLFTNNEISCSERVSGFAPCVALCRFTCFFNSCRVLYVPDFYIVYCSLTVFFMPILQADSVVSLNTSKDSVDCNNGS